MRPRFFLPLMLAAGAGTLHAEPAANIADVSWLAGCWSFARKEGFTEEHWLPPAGGAMLGLSRTIRGGRMTEFEYLSIREVDGKLSYVAIPSLQKETIFPMARFTGTELVFENPGHDFPQRVIYRKVPDGITVRIEGLVDGKSRNVDFPFRRCSESRSTPGPVSKP